MPGSVTNCKSCLCNKFTADLSAPVLAGRTYPLEGNFAFSRLLLFLTILDISGAAVLFPQHAPYTDPLRVLICGGSGTGAGIALDNCVSIAPEEENPTWVLERMVSHSHSACCLIDLSNMYFLLQPSRRVLACMVPLPDGTFMIMNGAHQGFAGFGLATDPNFNALLYDPKLPVGQRMSKLNSTTIARMYHSEAILLPDGRVMISGSDPLTNWDNGTVRYPEELRIEVSRMCIRRG
jgi:hypothetical protein